MRGTQVIVKPLPNAKVIPVLPQRWIVERTFAWRGHYRRLCQNYEGLPSPAEAWIHNGHDGPHVASPHGYMTPFLSALLSLAMAGA